MYYVCPEEADGIEDSFTHLDAKAAEREAPRRLPCRAPPQRELFDERG